MLRVLAVDDVRVARVWGTVLDGDQVIEQVEATPAGADWWELKVPTIGGRLLGKARDLAGNVAEMEYRE